MYKISDIRSNNSCKDILFVTNGRTFNSLGKDFIKNRIIGFLKYFIDHEELKNISFEFKNFIENGIPISIFYKGEDVTYDLLNFMKHKKDHDLEEFDNDFFTDDEYKTFAFTQNIFC